jgi:hypothetical protein
MQRNEAAMSFSSLNAGTMTEIFIPASLPYARPASDAEVESQESQD